MTTKAIDLDGRRGMAAQKATELRRLLSEVEANQETLRQRQQELEEQLLAAPASGWIEAADKARYLLALFASTPAGQDPRRQMLIARVLEDFMRLSSEQAEQDFGEIGVENSWPLLDRSARRSLLDERAFDAARPRLCRRFIRRRVDGAAAFAPISLDFEPAITYRLSTPDANTSRLVFSSLQIAAPTGRPPGPRCSRADVIGRKDKSWLFH